eukprot:723626-Pleurochrysis_carterae.AAC.1
MERKAAYNTRKDAATTCAYTRAKAKVQSSQKREMKRQNAQRHAYVPKAKARSSARRKQSKKRRIRRALGERRGEVKRGRSVDLDVVERADGGLGVAQHGAR